MHNFYQQQIVQCLREEFAVLSMLTKFECWVGFSPFVYWQNPIVNLSSNHGSDVAFFIDNLVLICCLYMSEIVLVGTWLPQMLF